MEAAKILMYLDERFARYEMPCFSNMNIDYLTTRMIAYVASPSDWVLIFNSVVWWPAGDGLMTLIESVGPGVVGRQGFDNDRHLAPGRIVTDDSGEIVTSIDVRGQAIEITSLDMRPKLGLSQDAGFWAAVALLPDYGEQLLASDQEVRNFVPSHLSKAFQTDCWEHPDFDRPPSSTESFPRLAAALCTGDFSALDHCEHPNVHWSDWLPK